MRIIYLMPMLILMTVTVIAQATCAVLDDAVLATLAACDQQPTGTACIATGTAIITGNDDPSQWNADDDALDLMRIDTLAASPINDPFSISLYLNDPERRIHLLAIESVTIENTAPRTEITVTATRNVNLRTMPSVDSAVLGAITIRTDYTAIARLSDSTWLQIRLDDGRIGWASAQFFVSRDGFAQLEPVTATTHAYLPMQSLRITTEDCGVLLLSTPDDEPVLFNINGAQITVDGVLAIQTPDEALILTSIIGQHTVDTFGFETALTTDESLSIPLAQSGTIANIPEALQATGLSLDKEAIDALRQP